MTTRHLNQAGREHDRISADRKRSLVDGRTPSRLLYFTATIITMDGSETNAYGEVCESGHGYTEAIGWWSPDEEPWSVYQDRDQAHPDMYPSTAETPPARWLADQLAERLGPIDHFDGGRTFYSADELIRASDTAPPQSVRGGAIHDPRRGLPVGAKTLVAAGHAHGFTRDEIVAAAGLLGLGITAAPAERRVLRPAASPHVRGFVALQDASQPSAARPMPDSTTAPPTPGQRGSRRR
jgi:hypothetical protein